MNAIPSSALAVFLLFATPARSAQEQQPANDPRVVGQAEIVLEQHRVQHADPDELFQIAHGLVGRSFFVREHGGIQSRELSNLRLLGDTIVLYDTQDQVQRARELLARLDVAAPARTETRVAREYRPRFVGLATAYSAAERLVREVSTVPARSLLVLHGTSAQVEEALALLQRIDQPEPQVLLTCQLLEVTTQAAGPALPRELTDNLQKLLPGSAFTQVGLAMLQTSVGGDEISMQIDVEGTSYRFSFRPAAFDLESGSLSAADCQLVEQRRVAGTPAETRELFRTQAVLRGGEYTVLAATGPAPRLLVVRVAPGR